MGLVVLVVEVEPEGDDEDSARMLRAAMVEVRDRLRAGDVPVRRAWAAVGAAAEAVAALNGEGR